MTFDQHMDRLRNASAALGKILPEQLTPEVREFLAALVETRRSAELPQILHYFKFEHLPEHLRIVSEPFCTLAHDLAADLEPSEERDVALRKLLEAKDAAVRAALN